MRYYFAPMEGLTDALFRALHHRYFPGVDRYYMPFLSPTAHRHLTAKEARELPAADSAPFTAVPQVLTKSAPDFLWAASVCRDLGYEELNLNLGCPSGTVTAKGKGAGMLRDLGALDAFLEAVFRATPLPVSVKTRLGLEEAAEFPEILAVLERYPIRELTIHPRVRRQFYKGPVHMDAFAYAAASSRLPLCYNGDITTLDQAQAIGARFPKVEAVMVGRGLIADPGMLLGGAQPEQLGAFMEALLEGYTAAFCSRRNAMFRLKEHWSYLAPRFSGSEKLRKRLRKTTDPAEFRDITAQILQLPLNPEPTPPQPCW